MAQIIKPEKIRSRRTSPAQEVEELLAKRGKTQQVNGNRKGVVVSSDIRYHVLGRLCAQRRAKENLSLRDVTRETGISASARSRIENGKRASTEHFVSLSRWVGITTEHISSPVVEDVPERVKSLILSDPKLDQEQSEALCSMFSVLYRQMAKQ